jgi:type I restriction enzyme, S subunit
MKVDTFFQNFELLTDAPNAVAKLREIILQLSVKGKLVHQYLNDEPASVMLKNIEIEKENLIKHKKIKRIDSLPAVDFNNLPYAIPKNWEWVRLGSLVEVITKGSSPKWQGINYVEDNSGTLFITSENVQNYIIDITEPKFVEAKFNEIEPRSILKRNDILMNIVGASIGRTAIFDRDDIANINQAVCLIRFISPEKFIELRYILHFFNSPVCISFMFDKQVDSARANLSMGNIAKFPIPLPPLAEQKRIVEKCDRLLSTCDEIEKRQQQRQESIVRMNESAIAQLLSSQNPDDFRQHWQRICNNFDLLYSIPETIPKLRQAILQLAVQGKLVGQDPNDEPTSVLLAKIKLEKEWLVKEKKIRNSQILPAIEIDEVAFKLPLGWEWTRLDDICSKITDGVHKTPKYTDYGIPFLSVTQLKNGMLDFNNTKYISPEDHQIFYQRCNPEKGDILICKVGGTIGVTAVVEVDIEFSIFVQLALIKQIIVNPYYLKLVLLSDEVQKYIKENSVGSAMPYISLEKLKYIQVPLPPLAEQKRIVEKCDRLMSLCDTLEAKLKQGRDSSEKLMEVAAKQVLTA